MVFWLDTAFANSLRHWTQLSYTFSITVKLWRNLWCVGVCSLCVSLSVSEYSAKILQSLFPKYYFLNDSSIFSHTVLHFLQSDVWFCLFKWKHQYTVSPYFLGIQPPTSPDESKWDMTVTSQFSPTQTRSKNIHTSSCVFISAAKIHGSFWMRLVISGMFSLKVGF